MSRRKPRIRWMSRQQANPGGSRQNLPSTGPTPRPTAFKVPRTPTGKDHPTAESAPLSTCPRRRRQPSPTGTSKIPPCTQRISPRGSADQNGPFVDTGRRHRRPTDKKPETLPSRSVPGERTINPHHACLPWRNWRAAAAGAGSQLPGVTQFALSAFGRRWPLSPSTYRARFVGRVHVPGGLRPGRRGRRPTVRPLARRAHPRMTGRVSPPSVSLTPPTVSIRGAPYVVA